MVGLAAHFLDTPAGGLASLTGLTSLNTLAADAYPPFSAAQAAAAAAHWATGTSGCVYGSDRDDVISLMTGMRSRQNSYCSHGSRWSYSSHVEQSLGNLRSVSRLDSSTGTRSCRNSLLAATLAVPTTAAACLPPAAVASAAPSISGGSSVVGQIQLMNHDCLKCGIENQNQNIHQSNHLNGGTSTNNEGSLSDEVSLWPPDYLVRNVDRCAF